ncbi:hypothetical protein [Polaromonas sp.]|uniref:hypothetical protein n=1 Tax=Polaromonas sp. TaxID=1869339 RepID=UPI0013BD82E3|nr:hypothetical protein [Polaromonas sp.]NDP64391.1 hypothetical protein [Polaromonas sp.]
MPGIPAAEVEQSKALWKGLIAPKLNFLSGTLSFICTRRALMAEAKAPRSSRLKPVPRVTAFFILKWPFPKPLPATKRL